MKRSEFMARVAGGALGVSTAGAMDEQPQFPIAEVQIERAHVGKPHAGKVLAAIQPHADDIPLFAGGLVLKLIQEGYTGYLTHHERRPYRPGNGRGRGAGQRA